MASVNKHVNYKLITSIAAATLLGLIELQSQTVKAEVNDTSLIIQQRVNQDDNNDPLFNGADVSNGYTDKGYTYVEPTLTSPERQDSYHLTTNQGWSNDLQTINYNQKDNNYNLYYLHTEGGANGNATGGQNWQRVTTKDFTHFSKPNTAIQDKGNIKDAWGSAWTGSIITNKGNITGVPKGAQVAYFSGLSIKDKQQNIWAAWSDNDGQSFDHILYNGFPVIDHYWDWTSKNKSDERDPSVFYWHNKLIMYAAEGNDLGVYQSADGLHWSKANPENESKVYNDQYFKGLKFEAPVECPVVRSMKIANGTVKQVLFFGAKSPQDGQTTGTYYIVGHLDNNGIFFPENDVKRLDQGTDYYGANFSGSDDLSKADDSLISMAWVGNWNYINSGIKTNQEDMPVTSKRLGAYTLARKLVLNNDNTISSTPITTNLEEKSGNEVNGNVSSKRVDENGNHELVNLKKQPANSKYVLHFSTKNNENYNGAVQIKFTQGKDNNSIIFNPANGQYRVYGNSSELTGAAADYYKNGLYSGLGYRNDSGLKDKQDFTLTIYTDKDSIELFFPNRETYTMARFCVNNIQDVSILSQDPNKNNKFNISFNQVGPDLVGYVAKPNDSKASSGNTDNNNIDFNSNNIVTPDNYVKPEKEPNNMAEIKGTASNSQLMHNAYIYDQNGKKISNIILQAYSILKTYGTKMINGKKYFVLSNDHYIAAGNISGSKRKLSHNAYIYNKCGKRSGKRVLKKNKRVNTYGSAKKINGKKYYAIGKNKFIKKANFQIK